MGKDLHELWGATMTFDERLKEALKALVVYERPNETAYQQIENIRPLSLEEAIAAIKQAMRETMPRHRTDDNMPIDEWLEKHPHVSPNLSHKARLQVAASRMFGWNECVDEIEKGFGL